MAIYLAPEVITSAIERLSTSRAKSRLHDFLIVKRTLAIKGEDSVAIAQSEPSFMTALNELSLTGLSEDGLFYFNPIDGNSGFRPEKYKSNGPNTTIGGNAWRKILDLSTNSAPRKASLAVEYEGQLEKFFLTSDAASPRPNLDDAAIWYFRGQDLASLPDPSGTIGGLRSAYVSLLKLSPAEVNTLFEAGAPANHTLLTVAEAPDPQSYLPVAASEEIAGVSGEGTLACSFDLVTALCAKPFVILSGPSGTGKSRVALKLAEAVQASLAADVLGSVFELVPVGPDWTSPRKLLGFKTPFGSERDSGDGTRTNDSYEITSSLRLILRALHPDSAGIPHFLILDEMNLSHVERYFAPFLSLMEAVGILSKENAPVLIPQESLELIAALLKIEDPHSPEAISAGLLVENGSPLTVPPNLLVIGTVNIDDTTYMFSPKVLDRAHVIEMQAQSPGEYLRETTHDDPLAILAPGTASQLLKVGIDDREEGRLNGVKPPHALGFLIDEIGASATDLVVIQDQTVKALEGCYKLLLPIGFQFGYRTSKEVYHYLYFWFRARHAQGTDWPGLKQGWSEALDKAIIQKVLPKLHGNRRSLLGSLAALSAFFEGTAATAGDAPSYALGGGNQVTIAPEDRLAVEPLGGSIIKLREMDRRLAASGYVSFVS